MWGCRKFRHFSGLINNAFRFRPVVVRIFLIRFSVWVRIVHKLVGEIFFHKEFRKHICAVFFGHIFNLPPGEFDPLPPKKCFNLLGKNEDALSQLLQAHFFARSIITSLLRPKFKLEQKNPWEQVWRSNLTAYKHENKKKPYYVIRGFGTSYVFD